MAEAECCEALAIFQRAVDTDPAITDCRRLVAAARNALGLLLIRTGRAPSRSSRVSDGDGGETDHLPGDALSQATILEGRQALTSRSRDASSPAWRCGSSWDSLTFPSLCREVGITPRGNAMTSIDSLPVGAQAKDPAPALWGKNLCNR